MREADAEAEEGSPGRVVHARLAPNLDLHAAVEALCDAQGLRAAFVRGGVGSLTAACLGAPGGGVLHVTGAAVEVLSLTGEVRPGPGGRAEAKLSGLVSDDEGRVFGGPFVPGANPVCMTLELTIEEWVVTA